MTRRAYRIALVLGTCTLAACVVNIAIDMQKDLTVQTTGSALTVNNTQAINLNDYPDFTAHKGNIKSLDLDSADVTVKTVNAGNAATKVSGSVTLRPGPLNNGQCPTDNSHDVAVGSLSNFPLTAGSTTKLPGTPELDAFLMSLVTGDGTFCAVVSGTIDAAPVNVTLSVTLHASLGYDTGLF